MFTLKHKTILFSFNFVVLKTMTIFHQFDEESPKGICPSTIVLPTQYIGSLFEWDDFREKNNSQPPTIRHFNILRILVCQHL